MAISENPTAGEIESALRRSAFIWACEYYDSHANEFADWYARIQPPLNFVDAFKQFQREGNKWMT